MRTAYLIDSYTHYKQNLVEQKFQELIKDKERFPAIIAYKGSVTEFSVYYNNIKLTETKIRAKILNNFEKEKIEIIPLLIYMRIVTGFIKFCMSKVMDGFDVKFPWIGAIGIRGKKVKPRIGMDGEIKGLIISWSKTFKLWKENPQAKLDKTVVYCFNEHSDGVRYKIVWYKRNVIFKNKSIYGLKFSRKNKRTLSNNINNGKEYLVSIN